MRVGKKNKMVGGAYFFIPFFVKYVRLLLDCVKVLIVLYFIANWWVIMNF